MSGRAWLNGDWYWIRVRRSDRRLVQVSTGTRDRRTATAIGRMVSELEDRGERAVLDAVADRRRSLLDVFASYRDDARLADFKGALDDTDIEPLVATWHAELVREGCGSAEKYLTQVRTFIIEGTRFPRSQFRRKAIAEHLAGLGVSGSTCNRYRSALMQFATWLVEREVIEHNPVRDVRATRENPPRMVYYSPSEVRSLIERLEGPYQAFEAIMAGTGMERQAVLRLRRRDIDFDAQTVHARGGKTEWRDRVCVVTEPWTWPYIEGHARTFTPNALLFDGLSYEVALARHYDACTAAKLPRSTLHDHRHTYAVTLRQRGVADVLIARQLGHHDTVLVARNYGRFTPDASDYFAALDRQGARKSAKVRAR
jgi:integrase